LPSSIANPSPYASDQYKCREILVQNSQAILPIFAVTYHRYHDENQKDSKSSLEQVAIEDIVFTYLSPKDPDDK